MPRAVAAVLLLAICSFATAGSYTDNPDLRALVDEVVRENGVKRSEALRVLNSAERKQAILDAIARPAEKTLSWAEYRPKFIEEKRIAQGIEFWNQYEADLARAEAQYGVPAEFIVAIIGVETRYGRNKGSWRIVDALSTLAFDYPPRAPFFRKQLKEFLRLGPVAHIDLMTATGSYAGAMGFPQFMPSSYHAWAVDFDNDGVTDLINDPVDAIGSVANYFREHGWRTGEPVAARAAVIHDAWDHVTNAGLDPKFTVGDIEAAGLGILSCNIGPMDFAVDFCADPAPDAKATAWRLEGERGAEFWVGLGNFSVITRYNRSEKYSLAVLQLAREVRLRREQAATVSAVPPATSPEATPAGAPATAEPPAATPAEPAAAPAVPAPEAPVAQPPVAPAASTPGG